MGASIAFHLAARGAPDVLLLERDAICSGPTRHSTAVIRLHYTQAQLVQMAAHGLRTYTAFEQVTGASSGFVRTGMLFGAIPGDRGRLEQNVALGQSLGVATDVVSAEEIEQIDPRVVADDLVFCFEPEAGHCDPYLVTSGFVRAAVRAGARVEEGVRVQAVREGGVQTDRGDVEAETVVVAAGPWTRDLLAPAGYEPPIHAARAEVGRYRLPDGFGPPPPAVADFSAAQIYFRPGEPGILEVGSLDPRPAERAVDPDAVPEGAEQDTLRAYGEGVRRGCEAPRAAISAALVRGVRRDARLGARHRPGARRRRRHRRGGVLGPRLQARTRRRRGGRRACPRRRVDHVRPRAARSAPLRPRRPSRRAVRLLRSRIIGAMSWDEAFAQRYDEWAAEMTEDVAFYVALAREADGPLVELAVGNGRVAIPVAQATGRPVIGIDLSPAMLEQARASRRGEGGARSPRRRHARLTLDEPAALIYCPFRALLHLPTWADRRRTFERVAASLRPGGRFAWNALAFDHGSPHRRRRAQDKPVPHTIRYAVGDNRIDITLEDGEGAHCGGRRGTSGSGCSMSPGSSSKNLYGGFEGTPFDEASREYVFVARR